MAQRKGSDRSALSWAGYASHTKKTPRDSRGEIEEALARYGATAFGYATSEPVHGEHRAWVAFSIDLLRIRMEVRLPLREECRTPSAHEQKLRTRWRLFLLLVRARLEAVANGVQTLEEAFLPDVVTESGLTVAETLRPQLEVAHATGMLPALLLAAPSKGMDADVEDPRPRPARRRGAPPPFPRTSRDDAKRPIAESPAADALVPVARLTSPNQRFACTPLAGNFTARTCLARQVQAASVRAGTCFRCPLGLEVGERLTRAAATPSTALE